jgi:hypothetical protein
MNDKGIHPFNITTRREFIRKAGLTAAGVALAESCLPFMAQGKPERPHFTPPKDIWLVPHDTLPLPDNALAITLQGLANRTQPRIWMRAGSMYQIIQGQLENEGSHFHEVKSVWELLKVFRNEVKGAILCNVNSPSMNVATSLCGPMNAVALDESLQSLAETNGLKILLDARQMDEKQTFRRYRDRFAKGIALEQTVEGNGPAFVRDYAVAHNAFTYYTQDHTFRKEVAKEVGPEAIFYGWGPDEYGWIEDLSSENATGVGSDWNVNLSALQHIPAHKPLHRPKRPLPKKEDGVRYVAFVMTDGDNIQWLCGSFVGNSRYWGSPLRGSFPMTWEISPMLTLTAPRVLEYLYETAKENEGFVTGAGVPGYTYIHYQTDPISVAKQAEPILRKADTPYVGIINANEGNLRETIPLLRLPDIRAVLYKDYAPYNRHQGKMFWYEGKPCISFKFALWEGLMSPQQVADGVNQMPSSPFTNEESYALVTVHAWSYGSIGGPLEAVKQTIALLPKNTRVVTADQLIERMIANLKK